MRRRGGTHLQLFMREVIFAHDGRAPAQEPVGEEQAEEEVPRDDVEGLLEGTGSGANA